MSFFDFLNTVKKDIGGAVGTIEKNAGGFLNNIVNPTAPVPTAIRKEAINIGHSIAKIPETTLRSVAQPGLAALTGNQTASTASGAVTDPVRSFLYGSHDPIQTYQQRGVGASEHLPSSLKGVGAVGLPVLLGSLDLSNLLGGGQGEKIAQDLAKTTTVQGVKDILGSAGSTVAQDVLSKIAKSTKPGEIKDLLKSATSTKDAAVAALTGTKAPGAEEAFKATVGSAPGVKSIPTGSVEDVLTRAAQDSNALSLEKATKPNYFQRVTTPVQKLIGNMGESGQKLSNLMTTQRDIQDKLANDWIKQIPTVNKLGKNEIGNFFDVVEHGAQADTPKITQAVKEWTALTPTVREEALRANLNVGNIENYVPHNYQEIFKDRNKFNQAVNYLVNKGLAKDAGEAVGQINGLRQTLGREGNKFGSLEKSRLTDLPYYEKSKSVLQDYLTRAATRVSEARTYGPADEIANKLIAGAGKEGHDIPTAKRAFDIAVGNVHYDPAMSAVSKGVRSALGVAKLGTAAVSHLGQPLVNTAPVAGIGRTIAAYAKTLSPENRAFVEESAVRAENVINEIKKGEGYTGLLSKFTAPGLNTLQKLNRSVSAIAGRDWANSLAAKGDAKALEILKNKLGVTGEIGSKLTRDQEIQAARRLTDLTQFRMAPRDLPMFASSPEGKFITQFRTFAMKETGFMKNEILTPAKNGNFAPLLRLIAVGLPVGYGINTIKNTITGHDASGDSTTKKVIDAYNRVGAFGLPGTVAESFQYTKNAKGQLDSGKLLQALAGDIAPAAGEAVKAVNKGVTATNSKDPAAVVGGYAASNVPVVGSRLAAAINPYNPKGSSKGPGRPRGSGKGRVKGRIGSVGKISKGSRGTRARKGTGRTIRVSTKSRAIKALRRI